MIHSRHTDTSTKHHHFIKGATVRSLCIAVAWSLLWCADMTVSGQNTSPSSNAAKSEKKVFKPGSAWTLSSPLGLHNPSTIDTLLYNYQRLNIPSMKSDAYATTGNLGAEGIDMIYFDRQRQSHFFFDNALYPYLMTFGNQKFYNVYVPMTLLSYNFAGGRENHQDLLSATFAGNVNRRIGIGGQLDYLHSKGCYAASAAKGFSWGLSGYYTGDRYEAQAFYQHFNHTNLESGGITDDLYITDPAELQGGVSKIDAKSIPTRLSAAQTNLRGDQFWMSHALKLGFWKEEEVNDTLTRDVYVPVTRFIYSLSYSNRHHTFLNRNAAEGDKFWKNRYLTSGDTEDNTHLAEVTNTIGFEMIEGFQKWAKFGLSAYLSYQHRWIKQTPEYLKKSFVEGAGSDPAPGEDESLTPLPAGISIPDKARQNLMWVGGRLSKQQGSILRYEADIKAGLLGDVIGDLEANGIVNTRFKMLGDTVSITANAHFSNLKPEYLLRKYISNHFVWDNDFGQTRRLRFGGELLIPWTRTTVSANFENVQNQVYFDSNSLPAQYGGSVQLLAVSLDQKLRFGIWNWDNRVTYQTSSRQDVLPLPALSVYSNMYLQFKAFRALTVQFGVDCDYYTRYRGYAYQPATMSFHIQGENPVDVGNFAFCNVYLTCKLYKVRFYAMVSHVNQGLFSSSYFSLPHYPVNPRRLQLGLSVDFAD